MTHHELDRALFRSAQNQKTLAATRTMRIVLATSQRTHWHTCTSTFAHFTACRPACPYACAHFARSFAACAEWADG
eukprot:13870170-Alexandrium_andersonii.AAC.1